MSRSFTRSLTCASLGLAALVTLATPVPAQTRIFEDAIYHVEMTITYSAQASAIDLLIRNMTDMGMGTALGGSYLRFDGIHYLDGKPYDDFKGPVSLHGSAIALGGQSATGVFGGGTLWNGGYGYLDPTQTGAFFEDNWYRLWTFGCGTVVPSGTDIYGPYWGIERQAFQTCGDGAYIEQQLTSPRIAFTDATTFNGLACVGGDDCAVQTANALTRLPITTPEPASLILLGTGLLSIAAVTRRRRARS